MHRRALLSLAAAGLCMSLAQATPAPSFSCSLRVEMPNTKTEVLLHFSLRNTATHAVQVLKWGTPLEGEWLGDYLAIHHQGEALPYRGPMAKRAPPQARDYLLLKPGQEVKARVRLDEVFDLSANGSYALKPQLALWDVVSAPAKAPRPFEAHQRGELACAPLRFELSRQR